MFCFVQWNMTVAVHFTFYFNKDVFFEKCSWLCWFHRYKFWINFLHWIKCHGKAPHCTESFGSTPALLSEPNLYAKSHSTFMYYKYSLMPGKRLLKHIANYWLIINYPNFYFIFYQLSWKHSYSRVAHENELFYRFILWINCLRIFKYCLFLMEANIPQRLQAKLDATLNTCFNVACIPLQLQIAAPAPPIRKWGRSLFLCLHCSPDQKNALLNVFTLGRQLPLSPTGNSLLMKICCDSDPGEALSSPSLLWSNPNWGSQWLLFTVLKGHMDIKQH